MKKALLFGMMILSSTAWAQRAITNAPLNIRTANGTVSNYPYQLKVPNSSLTDGGDGTMTLSYSTTSLNGSAIINSSVLQSGTTFYVSSGTATNFNTTSLKFNDGTTQSTASHVLQVLQFTITAGTSTTSASFAATSLTGSITPSSTSSKIFIFVAGELQNTAGSNTSLLTILRNGSNILGTSGQQEASTGAAGAIRMPTSLIYLDSPSSVSSLTYTVGLATTGGTATFCAGSETCTLILVEYL